MEITIAAIGKLKSSPELELFNHYIKLSGWKVNLREFEEKRNLSVAERRQSEESFLFSAVPDGAVKVIMDERGKIIRSTAFAEKMSMWQEQNGKIAFLIGGADGFSDEARTKADFLLSLGQMTWPHFLARVMLAEQIYRAKTIITGHPYHRE